MVNLPKDGNDWKAWALSLFIAAAACLSLYGINSTLTRIDKLETKLDSKMEQAFVVNKDQDICIAEIKKDVSQIREILKPHIKPTTRLGGGDSGKE